MNREQLMESVKSQMPERRWLHTLGVMQSAVQLAERFGADPARAEIAAILHDVCKFWPLDKQADILRRYQMDVHVLDYAKELWHAPAGACIAKHQYGIEDTEIVDAIRYHTSGRVDMHIYEKIICLADYIEPSRDFPGVDAIRQLATDQLDKALVAGFDNTIRHLLDKQAPIFPLTIEARNDLLRRITQMHQEK